MTTEPRGSSPTGTMTRFMGLDLETGLCVLTPREETELLGRASVALMQHLDAHQFIDMCCGVGNLACGIAAAVPGARGWASDLTGPCVALASRNVERLGLSFRVQVVQGDLFAELGGRDLEGNIDVVVCNPPYISTGKLERESAPLLEQEPREAFDGGPYGLSIQQRVIREAIPFLRGGGALLLEMGVGQEKQLELLFRRARSYEAVEFVVDGAGVPRVVVARKKV